MSLSGRSASKRFLAVGRALAYGAIALMAAVPGSPRPAFADDAVLSRMGEETLSSEELDLKIAEFKPGKKTCRIKGLFRKPTWILLWDGALVAGEHGKTEFELAVALKGRVTPIELVAVSQHGEIAREKFELVWEGYGQPKVKETLGSRFRFGASAGPTYLAFFQSRVVDYRMTAITAKGAVQYEISPNRWDLSLGGFMNTAILSTRRTDGLTARFLGGNLRVAYALPFVRDPWRVSVMTGLYYSTMLVTEDAFGFSNMLGPQLFLAVDRRFGTRNRITAYGKFSPVAQGLSFSLFGLSTHELANGVGYVRQFKNGHSISVNGDFSFFRMQFGSTQLGYDSYSLSLGYGL